MAQRTERIEGTLASWNDDRGFGFISPVGGGHQVFVHIRAFPQGSKPARVGEQLSFEIETTPQGKTRARYVRVAGSSPIQKYGRARESVLSYLPIVAFAVLYFVVQILWHPTLWAIAVYVVTSGICFVIYAVDKSAAIGGRWRVSESALLLLGLAGGWPGALVAQHMLRHKTTKRSFQVAFAGSIVANILAFVYLSSPALSAFIRVAIG